MVSVSGILRFFVFIAVLWSSSTVAVFCGEPDPSAEDFADRLGLEDDQSISAVLKAFEKAAYGARSSGPWVEYPESFDRLVEARDQLLSVANQSAPDQIADKFAPKNSGFWKTEEGVRTREFACEVGGICAGVDEMRAKWKRQYLLKTLAGGIGAGLSLTAALGITALTSYDMGGKNLILPATLGFLFSFIPVDYRSQESNDRDLRFLARSNWKNARQYAIKSGFVVGGVVAAVVPICFAYLQKISH